MALLGQMGMGKAKGETLVRYSRMLFVPSCEILCAEHNTTSAKLDVRQTLCPTYRVAFCSLPDCELPAATDESVLVITPVPALGDAVWLSDDDPSPPRLDTGALPAVRCMLLLLPPPPDEGDGAPSVGCLR